MSKSDWENRVGMLLDPHRSTDFVYSYKPIDGMHGGQPKIDWHACDRLGRYWMIEVKWIPDNRRSINYISEITPGQRDGLSAISMSKHGVALLMVGQGKTLYLFDWHEVTMWVLEEQHRQAMDPSPLQDQSLLLPFDVAFERYPWSGPKSWTYRLLDTVEANLERYDDLTQTTQTEPVVLSPAPEPSRPTLRRKASTPILPMMRRLEP